MSKDQPYLTFGPGEIIIKKDDPAERTFMILSGSARVFLEEDGKHVELAILKEDDIFGETAIFTNQAYGATVETCEETEVFVITPESLNDMLKFSDPIIRALIKMLIERLRKTNDALLKSETREFIDVGFI